DLLTQARLHNAAHGITGVLLYGNDQFFQVMEGEATTVQALYERIQQDPRHGSVTTFADKDIAERAFPEWSMAFNTLTPRQLLESVGYTSPDQLRLERPSMALADKQLLQLLRSFVLPG
ncbi:MAG: BLUF domain-containing protein, partial [Hymenobacter sp.]